MHWHYTPCIKEWKAEEKSNERINELATRLENTKLFQITFIRVIIFIKLYNALQWIQMYLYRARTSCSNIISSEIFFMGKLPQNRQKKFFFCDFFLGKPKATYLIVGTLTYKLQFFVLYLSVHFFRLVSVVGCSCAALNWFISCLVSNIQTHNTLYEFYFIFFFISFLKKIIPIFVWCVINFHFDAKIVIYI